VTTEIAVWRPPAGLRAVISGVGSVRDRLAAELASQDVARPMIVCGANLARSPMLPVLREAIGTDAVVYDGCRPHVPAETVDAGAELARSEGVDGIVALGGSSAIDLAKGIAVLVATRTPSLSELAPLDFGQLGASRETSATVTIPVATVTTTLSFAEFFGFWGARHADRRRKLPYGDAGAVPRTIFLDGEFAADTPDGVWAETGIKALDDALSTYCRNDRPDPFVDAVLVPAIVALCEELPRSLGGGDAETRQRVLTAVWMTKHALPRLVSPALPGWFSTAARHSLGGVYELPHGVGSCVSLPVGLRFHHAATVRRQDELAAALGWPSLEKGLGELLERLGVPTRLGQLGVDVALLDDVADAILAESPGLGDRAAVRAACEEMR
jgi:alcohol dehydrogenase class IV